MFIWSSVVKVSKTGTETQLCLRFHKDNQIRAETYVSCRKTTVIGNVEMATTLIWSISLKWQTTHELGMAMILRPPSYLWVDWCKVLHPTWHKMRHTVDVLPTQSLGSVMKTKPNITSNTTTNNLKLKWKTQNVKPTFKLKNCSQMAQHHKPLIHKLGSVTCDKWFCPVCSSLIIIIIIITVFV